MHRLDRSFELEARHPAGGVGAGEMALAEGDELAIPEGGVLLVEGDESFGRRTSVQPREREREESCEAVGLGFIVEQVGERDGQKMGLDRQRVSRPSSRHEIPVHGVGSVDGFQH